MGKTIDYSNRDPNEDDNQVTPPPFKKEPTVRWNSPHEKQTTPKTTVVMGSSKRTSSGNEEASSSQVSTEKESGPVVGWLVVIDGPGKGHSFEVHSGRRTIGRGASSDICLDFGDHSISASRAQAVITYDVLNNHFYIQPGESVNLLYLVEGEKKTPINAPVELTDRQELFAGETTLKFIALCDGAFKWS